MSDNDEVEYELVSPSQVQMDLRRELVIVPEWKTPSGKSAAFFVSELIADDYDEYQQGMIIMGEGADFTMSLRRNAMRLIAHALRDANGNRVYPDAERGIAELGQLGQGGIDRLATVARRLNGLSKNAAKDAEGKSGPAPSGGSSSASPSPSATPPDGPS